MTKTRIPTQKRSIEKRNKIIEKGFKLMCEKGYYNTNTTEIAKYADVSTGIIYQYFNDKKDIFLEGVKNYSNSILYPMINILEEKSMNINNLDKIIEDVINKCITKHTISKKAHEELMAMSHLDEDISNIFKDSEILEFNSYNECDRYFNMWRGYTSELIHKKDDSKFLDKYKYELI